MFQRALSRKFWAVSSQTLLGWSRQACTSSPTLTRRKCSKFNSESYGFECGTAWVSKFLSFDFTQYETQGLNLIDRTTEHLGMRLNSLCCKLAVLQHQESSGSSLSNATAATWHCISSAVFFLFLVKNGNNSRTSSLGKSVFQSLQLI